MSHEVSHRASVLCKITNYKVHKKAALLEGAAFGYAASVLTRLFSEPKSDVRDLRFNIISL